MSRRTLSALLVVVAAAVMLIRAPTYFTAPSFWAEEGLLYFVHAWSHHWWETLLVTPSGYYLLWANVAASIAAGVAPLRLAPLVTTLLALAVQLAPVALVAFGEAPEWRTPARRAVGVAIVLFASLTDEIWLNTINSQFHLSLLAVLLLLEPAAVTTRRAAVYAALVALSGLTGPVSCFLAPLYLVKAWHTRARPAIVQAGVLVAASIVQSLIVWHVARAGLPGPPRTEGLALGTFGLIVWMKALLLPIVGGQVASAFVAVASRRLGGDMASPTGRVFGGVLIALALAVVGWLAAGPPRARGFVLAGSWVLLTFLSIASSVGDKGVLLHAPESSSRYFYAPGAILLMLLLANVDARRAVRRLVCATLLAVGIGTGVARYHSSLRWQATWPVWKTEVAAWERDPHHALQIWPPGWKFHLAARDHS